MRGTPVNVARQTVDVHGTYDHDHDEDADNKGKSIVILDDIKGRDYQ